jgi:hypothetical protein
MAKSAESANVSQVENLRYGRLESLRYEATANNFL